MSEPIKQYDLVYSEYFGAGIGEKPNGKYCLYSDYLSVLKRAETAEAKLAELEKQEPVIEVIVDGRATDDYMFNINNPLPNGIHELFTRPAPAVSLAELVPDDWSWKEVKDFCYALDVTVGANACYAVNRAIKTYRATTLRNIEEAKC